MKQALLAAERKEASNDDPAKKRPNPYFTKRYVGGFILLALSGVTHVAVLPFCDLVLLSTLTAAGIVISTLLAIKYLGETFVCKYDLPSFTLIILGCTTIVVLSNQEETEYPPERIKALLKSTAYIVFAVFYVIVAISTFLIFKWVMGAVTAFGLKADLWVQNMHKTVKPDRSSETSQVTVVADPDTPSPQRVASESGAKTSGKSSGVSRRNLIGIINNFPKRTLQ